VNHTARLIPGQNPLAVVPTLCSRQMDTL